MASITTISLPLPRVANGKVRDLFALPTHPSSLLIVATDRISAYDVILTNGIPDKGILLTQLTAHWFEVLPTLLHPSGEELKHHFLHLGPPQDVANSLSGPELQAITPRSMTVRKLRIIPIEAIVRGYVAGSAWKEYSSFGTVHGIPLPTGLKQCGIIPGGAIYTPSTKAPAGEHDENIHPSKAAEIIGDPHIAAKVERLALIIYKAAAAYAYDRGIIIADTKFEFGIDDDTGDVVLVDEVLTPDSSRFWPRDRYKEGRDQESFDKQILRNWLVENGLKGMEYVSMDEAIAKKTAERYQKAYSMITKNLE